MSKHQASAILFRAAQLGILLWVDADGKIKYRGKDIPQRMLEVLKANKAELLEYLPTVCMVCQNEVAHYSPEGMPYCQFHHDQIIAEQDDQRIQSSIEAWMQEMYPNGGYRLIDPHAKADEPIAFGRPPQQMRRKSKSKSG